MASPSRRDVLTDLFLAAGLALVAFLWIDPASFPLNDDGAIVLRYLKQFRAGHWFAYNPGDGPAFGVSGPLHLFLSCAATFVTATPEAALWLSNVVGTWVLFLFLLRLLSLHYPAAVRLPAAAVVALAGTQLGGNLFNGLESALHLGILLGALYFFLSRSPWQFPFAALAIVSKLDATPAIAGLVALAVLRDRVESPQRPWREIFRDLAMGGGVPLLVWVLFATIVFGSPIPLSAQVKVFLTQQPFDGSFRFFRPFIGYPALTATLALALGAGVVASVVAFRRGEIGTAAALTVTAGISVGQFLFFRPGEQHPWYYVSPDCLVLLLAITLPGAVWKTLAHRPNLRAFVAPALALVVFSVGLAPRLGNFARSVAAVREWGETVEDERVRAGKRAAEISTPLDLLVAGHGHIAYEYPGYVLDLSGLNSKAMVERRLRLSYEELGETVGVWHGVPSLPQQRSLRYAFDRCYSTFELSGFPALCVFRLNAKETKFVRHLTAAPPSANSHTRFDVGESRVSRLDVVALRGRSPQWLKITARIEDGRRIERRCVIPASQRLAGRVTATCRVSLPGTRARMAAFEITSRVPVALKGAYAVFSENEEVTGGPAGFPIAARSLAR